MRLEGLDRVRAGAMLLGVAYHATYAFVPDIGPYFPVQARSTWSGFAVLAAILHSARMPVFFAVSGFFAALVMERRPERFLSDRFRRLMVPLLVALPFSLAADVYIRRASIRQGTMHAGYAGQGDWLFRPLHLWFLEYVFLFCGVAFVLSKVKFKFRGDSLLRVPEALLLGAVLTAGVVLLLGEPQPAFTFLPTVNVLLFFAPFFALGWVMFSARESTGVLQRRTWWMLPVAAVLALSVFTNAIQWQPIGVVLSALVAWLTVIGLMGIALRPGTTQSPGLLVQSAYWVYLVHHPLVQGAQVLVAPLEWSAALEYTLVVALAFAVSLGSFVLVVRRSPLAPWVGATRAVSS